MAVGDPGGDLPMTVVVGVYGAMELERWRCWVDSWECVVGSVGIESVVDAWATGR